MIHKLEVDSIFLEFESRRILTDVYLKCETGIITGLLGRNGNGKSCLMKIIYGSLSPLNNSIRLNDNYVSQLYLTPQIITYLPQVHFVPKHLTLKRIFSDFELDYNDFEQYFPDLKNKHKHAIGELSGGYRRLVEIYLIIKSPSYFSLLDEPFSNLSTLLIESIQELIVVEKKKKGFLITDHMYTHVVKITDDIYVLADGATYFLKHEDDLIKFEYLK